MARGACRSRVADQVRIGQVVVARPEALDLVKYLQGLDHTYPVLPPPPRSAAGPAAGSAS